MKTIFYPLLALAIACCASVGCTTKGDLETSDRSKISVQSISDEHFVGIDQVLSYIGDKGLRQKVPRTRTGWRHTTVLKETP